MIPNLQNAVRRFEQTLQVELVKKTIIDGDVAESAQIPVPIFFEGTILPMHPRQLEVKPEGERAWKWWTLITDLVITTDTVVKDSHGTLFRVMSSTDWSDAEYRQYELVEGPDL